MPATHINVRVQRVLTRLQEIMPSSGGNLRENLTGDASPGVDSPAEKQEVAFWKAVLATLDKHGHDYKAAVQELRTSAEMKVAELSESAFVKELHRQRRHPATAADSLKAVRQRSAPSSSTALTEATKPLREYPETMSRFTQQLRKGG